MIPEKLYRKIIEVFPVLCVDVIITNSRDEYLLVRRANEPMKGHWWVIGGRVLKGESLSEAAVRKVYEETNIHIASPNPVGFFEAPNERDPFGRINEYHSISIVYQSNVNDNIQIILDSQSTEWQFRESLPSKFSIQPFYHLKQEIK